MTTQKCAACHRKALPDSKYCLHHKQASDNMLSHYKAWVNAYGGISWEDFMDKLLKLKETGSWVKEVIAVEQKMKNEK
jgi:hypothetical protein